MLYKSDKDCFSVKREATGIRPFAFEILIHISCISMSSFHHSTSASTGAGELQFMQHGRQHGRPWCGHQLGPVCSIIADVASCAAQISASTMLIVSKWCGFFFSHASHTAPMACLALLDTGSSSIKYTRNVQQIKKLPIRQKWLWTPITRSFMPDLNSEKLGRTIRNITESKN